MKAKKQIDLEFYQEVVDAIAVSGAFQNGLKTLLSEAFKKPRSFYDEDGEFILSERGLTFSRHRDSTPKFVLIDKMIGANQIAE